MHIGHSLTLFSILTAVILFFVIVGYNVTPSQPRFVLTQLEVSKLHNILINKQIFIRFVAKC